MILESYDSAIKRGAPILAEIIGYGFSSNGDHISVPNIAGPVKSLQMALSDAGLMARDIDYINAHATSTPVGDEKEAQAIFDPTFEMGFSFLRASFYCGRDGYCRRLFIFQPAPAPNKIIK